MAVHSVKKKSINLGSLPVWSGVQNAPGIRRQIPFGFKVEDGLIRLNVEGNLKNTIVENYGNPDYSFITTPPGYSEWGTYLGRQQIGYMDTMLPKLEGKSVLEIGSGSLYIADYFVEHNKVKQFVACDPVLRKEKSRGMIKVVANYFSYEAFKDDRFDLVLSMNNLEHVPDPFSYLSEIRKLLKKSDGLLFVMVPDCTEQLEVGDWGICLHEHLSYFTLPSFSSVVTRAGFHIDHLMSIEDEIIALLSIMPVQNNSFRSEPNLDALNEKFVKSKNELGNLIQKLKISGDTPIGVHGCSAAVNHLFSLLGLDHDPDIYLFDRDEAKHGKYIPSFCRAVLDSADPQYKNMKAIVVGNTTYFAQIKEFALGQGIEKVYPLFSHPNNE